MASDEKFLEFLRALKDAEQMLEADLQAWSQTAEAWVVRVLFDYELPPSEIEAGMLRVTGSVHGDRRARFSKNARWTPDAIARLVAGLAPPGTPDPLLPPLLAA
jgi:hypothetical protein